MSDTAYRLNVELPITEGVCAILSGQSLGDLAAGLMGRAPTEGLALARFLDFDSEDADIGVADILECVWRERFEPDSSARLRKWASS